MEIETLKFKSGPLKGRRLDSIGMSFEIISDDRVRFKNGSTAVYYRDDLPVVLNDKYICEDCRAKGITWYGACPHPRPSNWPADLEPIRPSNPDIPKTFDYPIGPPINVHIENLESYNRTFEQEMEAVYEHFPAAAKLKIHGHAVLLGAFRTVDGKRLMHPCDAAYAVIERGQEKYTVTRQVVGTGWRELSWVYATLRQVGGRNVLNALFETMAIYFL